MKKYLFLLIIFFIPNVFAQDFNVNYSDVSSPSSSGTGKYTGTEIYNTGTSNVYNLGTRYSGQLSRIIFNLSAGGYAVPEGFEKGHNYTLSLNMATDDWRNKFGSVSVKCEGSSGQELSNGRVTYVSYRKIKFSFTAPSDRFCQFVYIDLKSSNITNTAFTGVTNWNLSSMVISDPYYCDNCGGASNPTPTPAPDYSSIINSQNQNTESIINNQNNNTNDVIDNSNQNTQEIINSNKQNLNVCYFNYFDVYKVGQIVNSNGRVERIGDRTVEVQSTLSGHNEVPSKSLITFAPDLQVGETYTLTFDIENVRNYIYLSSGFVWTNGTSRTMSQADLDAIVYFYANSNLGTGQYKRIMIQKTNDTQATGYIPYGETCSNRLDQVNNALGAVGLKIDTSSSAITGAISGAISSVNQNQNNNQAQTNQKLDDINNSINNSQIDDKTSFFTNFNNNTHGLTGIITLPLSTIQSLANSSCVTLSIPVPFTNDTFDLPCMTQIYQSSIPEIYSMWQVVSFGIISYYICLDIFKMVKGFKDPNEDKIEVLDL